jgi:hypothetical protein
MKKRLGNISKDLPPLLSIALSVGVGWGCVYVLVTYVSFLWKSIGPGDLLSEGCPEVSVFVVNGVLVTFMNILNVLFTVFMVDGYFSKKWFSVVLCFIFHYGASYFVFIFLFLFTIIIIFLTPLPEPSFEN